LGQPVQVDETKFGEHDLHDLVIHNGETLPQSFRQKGTGTSVATKEDAPQRPGLSKDENRALDLYTVGVVADGVNKSLRRGGNLHGDIDLKAVGKVDLDKTVRDLDSAIVKSHLSRDATLWRGSVVTPSDLARLIPGAVYSDGGFMSTSASEKGARGIIDWRKGQGLPSGRKAVLFKILAPAGLNGAVGHEVAKEVLLPRGQQLRVVRVENDGKVPVVVMEALPQGSGDAIRGKHLIDDFDYDALKSDGDFPKQGVGHRDVWGDAIWQQQGFDAKPKVVSSEELDKEIEDGAQPLYRGIRDVTPKGKTAKELAEQYRNGDAYGSVGVYGSGTYTTSDRAVAEGYGGKGELVRMALRKDARVISYNDLLKLRSKYGFSKVAQKLQDEQTAELAKVDPNDTEAIGRILAKYSGLRSRQGIRSRVMADEGRFASLLGYDAVYVPGGRTKPKHGGGNMENDEWLILNRGATIVAR